MPTVEPEGREHCELHRDDEPDRVCEQVLVAGRDALVEAQDVREVVRERDQARVYSDLPDAPHVHGRAK